MDEIDDFKNRMREMNLEAYLIPYANLWLLRTEKRLQRAFYRALMALPKTGPLWLIKRRCRKALLRIAMHAYDLGWIAHDRIPTMKFERK